MDYGRSKQTLPKAYRNDRARPRTGTCTLEVFPQIPAELIRSDIEIDFVGARDGAYILDSFYEATLADAFCLDIGSRAAAEGYAAVCTNSMSDSGVSALRSRLSIPVVGPGPGIVPAHSRTRKAILRHYHVATLGLDIGKACARNRP